MEENKEKMLDELIKKVVMEVGMEKPSKNFTDAVLTKIGVDYSESQVTSYKPLISKFTWGILAVLLIGIAAFLIFGNTDAGINGLWGLNLNTIAEYQMLDSINALKLPNTLVYSILALVLFIYVQIILIKGHVDKRYVLN